MSARLIDSAPPRASEQPAAPSAAPARPASEDSGQRSREIIPGDDPGDQQPSKLTSVPVIHVDIDRSKANELGILDTVDQRHPGSAGRRTLCQPVQPRRPLLLQQRAERIGKQSRHA